MNENKWNGKNADLRAKLKINCEKCSGLCCVALYCMKTDGFPADKDAGIPCKNLLADYRCGIHSKLALENMRGCLAYDCFGAGQKVTQDCYPNVDWKTTPDNANEIFKVFLTVFQFHQMAWYLLESLSLITDERLKSNIETLITENERITNQPAAEIMHYDIKKYQTKVNKILKKVSELASHRSPCRTHTKDYFGENFKKANLDGMDFSMTLLIAANLKGCSLHRTNFLGADMRDANIRNTDLSTSIFLTQMQINSAKGNSKTKLPEYLTTPASWQEQ